LLSGCRRAACLIAWEVRWGKLPQCKVDLHTGITHRKLSSPSSLDLPRWKLIRRLPPILLLLLLFMSVIRSVRLASTCVFPSRPPASRVVVRRCRRRCLQQTTTMATTTTRQLTTTTDAMMTIVISVALDTYLTQNTSLGIGSAPIYACRA